MDYFPKPARHSVLLLIYSPPQYILDNIITAPHVDPHVAVTVSSYILLFSLETNPKHHNVVPNNPDVL